MLEPYSHAAAAYGQTGRAVVSQREMEANALLKAARAFETIRSAWPSEGGSGLADALLYNRKLWTIFAAEAANDDNPLPLPIRNGIANISIFVLKRTVELQAAPAPEKIEALININKNIAAGLLTQTPADGAAPKPSERYTSPSPAA